MHLPSQTSVWSLSKGSALWSLIIPVRWAQRMRSSHKSQAFSTSFGRAFASASWPFQHSSGLSAAADSKSKLLEHPDRTVGDQLRTGPGECPPLSSAPLPSLSWPSVTMIWTLFLFSYLPLLLPPQSPLSPCTITYCIVPLFPFCLFPCTFTTASPTQPGLWLIVMIVAVQCHCSLCFQFLPYDS